MAFRVVGERLRRVADTLRGNIVRLGLSWGGRTSDRFMEWFLPFPSQLEALAEVIDTQAGRINHKTVTVIETILVSGGETKSP